MTVNRKYIFIGIASVLIIVAMTSALWLNRDYFNTWKELSSVEQKEGSGMSVVPSYPEDTIAVRIFYPSGNNLVFEQKSIPNNPLPVKMAENLLTEYLQRMEGDLKTTKLLGVYKDRENILYIDLSDSFAKNFQGGAEQEYFLLKSLYDTIVSNISVITDIKILIEGKETESIGGHFYSLYPLKELFADSQQPVTANRQSN